MAINADLNWAESRMITRLNDCRMKMELNCSCFYSLCLQMTCEERSKIICLLDDCEWTKCATCGFIECEGDWSVHSEMFSLQLMIARFVLKICIKSGIWSDSPQPSPRSEGLFICAWFSLHRSEAARDIPIPVKITVNVFGYLPQPWWKCLNELRAIRWKQRSKRNDGKYENTRDQARYSDFNIEMMSVFTAPFFFAPVVRYYPLSFPNSSAVYFHSNPSDKRMLSQRTTGRDYVWNGKATRKEWKNTDDLGNSGHIVMAETQIIFLV
jgi:hypothetical protein